MKSLSVGDEVPFSLHRISFLPVQKFLSLCNKTISKAWKYILKPLKYISKPLKYISVPLKKFLSVAVRFSLCSGMNFSLWWYDFLSVEVWFCFRGAMEIMSEPSVDCDEVREYKSA